MSRFYVTLPSNSSMDYYPDNTVAKYVTKLPEKIELEGDWEVGMTEISVPVEVSNVVGGKCYYEIFVNEVPMHLILLPSHNHSDMEELVETLHLEQMAQVPLREDEPLLASFSYNDTTGKMTVTMPVVSNMFMAIRFSRGLSHLLGMEPRKKYFGDFTGEHSVSLVGGTQVNRMYVYCDLLEHVTVGDTKAPLLRIVDKPKEEQDVNVHKVFNPIHYVPLQKKNFDTMEINIMTDAGEPVPFLFGKSFVVLEFRRTVHPYFGL